ncbi:DoxX family protein [Pseudoclavibacter helvolus]|uniref:DoxX family protein n=1 Tax=Pseudoclavibacter helvolus TaxID=255205 RepID=UPI003C769AEE
MTFLPDPWWPTVLLAGLLAGDAAMSITPPKFIRDCLDGVRFPRDWWWTLIVIKATAALGLIAGLWLPGVAFAANVGVIAYFVCAAAAHVRARFLGRAFWLNCLGMLAVAVLVLVVTA